ncbi:uncharacterized protein LOC134836515 [Culicoides brevitarsis]|uniref:uncharacterized protein LOC134836515 n=1 Tax=Culicoides brevitarsis TaxID=469753 RepID=UPI00307C379C
MRLRYLFDLVQDFSQENLHDTKLAMEFVFVFEPSHTFNFVSKTLDQLLVYFCDETKRNSANITKGLIQMSKLWEKKVTLVTEFHEKSKILVRVIRLFYFMTPKWDQICEQPLQSICTKYIPETFDLLPRNQLDYEEVLCAVQNILLQLTSLCSIDDLPQKYQSTLVTLILEHGIDHKYFLQTCPNQWMEDLVDFMCIQQKITVKKVSEDPNDCETQEWLRLLNTKLIDLSKAFPHHTFRGTKFIMQALVFAYSMMNCGYNNQIIQTNAVTPCLAVLEQIYLNKELVICIFDITEEPPSTIVPLLTEIVNIFSRPSSKLAIQNFSEVNIFEILFDAIINLKTDNSSTLLQLAQCLALYTLNEIGFQKSISRLLKALMSENLCEAYWSLNVWILIARICSEENCYIYFEEFAQMFVDCKNEQQKFFLGKTMKAFFECLKSNTKAKIQEKYPPELNISIWTQIGMHNISEPQIIEKLFTLTENTMTEFLENGNREIYEKMCLLLKLCSTNSTFNPENSLFAMLKDITEFLIANSMYLSVFDQLINSIMQICIVYINKICDITICNVLTIIKENHYNSDLSKKFIQRLLSTGQTLDETLSEDLKCLLLQITKDSEITDIERKLLEIGYNVESFQHICHHVNFDEDDNSNAEEEIDEDEGEEICSPKTKKRKIELEIEAFKMFFNLNIK